MVHQTDNPPVVTALVGICYRETPPRPPRVSPNLPHRGAFGRLMTLSQPIHSKITMKERNGKSYNRIVLEMIKDRPIAFIPLLGKVAKSASAGLFLSQLLYWWGKGSKEDWIYKTIKEMKDETCLSRGEQDTAIKIWKVYGVIKTKLSGVPPKRNFQISFDVLMHLLSEHQGQSNVLESANQFVEKGTLNCNSRQNITESTPDKTNR